MCIRINSCCTIWHFTASVSITFARSVWLQSYLRLPTSTSSLFLFILLCPCRQFCLPTHFPNFLPSYSDWVQVRVSILSLFQFYGCWYPWAPVFVVSLFLFAHAETQRRISMTTQDNTIPPETKESPSPTILLNIQKIPAIWQHSEKLKSLTSIHDPCKSSDCKILGQNNDNNVQQK